ncbi:IST1 homolog isoform X3 [Manis pentadactyla]|uniref:IST1 homolog isoform X3 n=1 Tax=Manis pentadactyla TaxID=143292 RepID=UPI001876EE80|nr:IST1 homolog isoform X3 [Manis pentadactyla]
MFSSAFKADRLQVNLQLVVNRLKLLEKKKTEQVQKARKEVADYLAAGKEERAGIRVEHIIREDYLVEAMEILELYCDLLLARFSLIQATKKLDSCLAESVSTLIWAAPRLQSEVPELKIVSSQLCAKYSQEYGQLCRTNEIGTVSSQDEARSDLVGIGLAEDVKKGTLGRSGTVVGPGEPPGAWPVPAPGPLPVPSPAPCFSSLPPESQNNSYKKNDLLPSPIPSLGLIPQTSPKPVSRVKIGFDKFMLPGLPDVKPQGSLSIDPCGFEEVDFEDLNRRLEMLKKTT